MSEGVTDINNSAQHVSDMASITKTNINSLDELLSNFKLTENDNTVI